MLLSGFAMMIHMLIPFWQQPKWLQGDSIRDTLDKSLRRQMLRKIARLVYFLSILIIIDLTATLFWVRNGLATEANPVMDFFLQHSPILFVLTKLGLSVGGLYILYFFGKRFKRKVFYILLILNLIYLIVFGYHLWAALFLLFSTI